MKLTKGSRVTLKGDPQRRVGRIVSDCRGLRVRVQWEGRSEAMTHRLDRLESTQKRLI